MEYMLGWALVHDRYMRNMRGGAAAPWPLDTAPRQAGAWRRWFNAAGFASRRVRLEAAEPALSRSPAPRCR